ncbi:MAG: helix-turn-helix domain-containing protein, partial [Candidatus Diapherotrites archaeon]|nr:helix-turn-helix domain-containing protein [Candidatus Diapherotrites archaeon]
MDPRTLEEFGLTPNEAKVYLSLVVHGPSTASAVTRDSGLHRVLVYDVLVRLSEKGLVGSVVKAGSKVFEAASPKELVDRLDRAEEEVNAKRKRLQQVYPSLMVLFSNVKEKQGVFFFKG